MEVLKTYLCHYILKICRLWIKEEIVLTKETMKNCKICGQFWSIPFLLSKRHSLFSLWCRPEATNNNNPHFDKTIRTKWTPLLDYWVVYPNIPDFAPFPDICCTSRGHDNPQWVPKIVPHMQVSFTKNNKMGARRQADSIHCRIKKTWKSAILVWSGHFYGP